MGEKDKEDNWRNKIDLMVRKSNGFETSVYYHLIYGY